MSQSVLPVVESKQIDNSPTLTFEEYRFYQTDSDLQYELYKGQLISLPTVNSQQSPDGATGIEIDLKYKLVPRYFP
jgi:hypothetical protein